MIRGMRSTITGIMALAKRLVFVLPVIWAVVTLVFLLIHIVPGDPVRNALGDNATEEQVRELKQKLGLDLPLSRQYVNYWRGVFRGDLGVSHHAGRPSPDGIHFARRLFSADQRSGPAELHD